MPHKEVVQDGIVLPSVTQIIGVLQKDFLLRWYGRYGTAHCEKVKREAANFGTEVHDAITSYLQGSTSLQFTDGRREKAFQSWLEWYQNSGFNIVDFEPKEPVKSLKYGYQGTYDAIGNFADSKLWVADWKTSSQMSATFGLQLAAYAYAYGESHGWEEDETWEKMPNGLIVRIDKETARAEVKEFLGLKRYFSVFKSLIEPYKFVHGLGEWEK